MDANLTIELIKLIPAILWFLLAVVLVLLFYKPIRHNLLPQLSAFKALGMEFSFVRESISTAIEVAEKSKKWEVTIPEEDRISVENRVRKHLHLFRHVRILWIDDVPENNRDVEEMFNRLNVRLDNATGTEEALSKLKHHQYDVILSDMVRDGDQTAGLKFLAQYSRQKKRVPVIFYVGTIDPEKGVPPKAFGITHRPDELLHLILDVLERRKY
ncbi:MAG: response regulator [Calditrichae bacterium]|nr:response regulator [Calditrichia bacterium]